LSKRAPQNSRLLVTALAQLGFKLTEGEILDIERGKDFVQLKDGPFDLDLVFAPDGIERFEDAWRSHIEIEGFPACHPDDIIASKAAANRPKDREGLPRLKAFRDYWLKKTKKAAVQAACESLCIPPKYYWPGITGAKPGAPPAALY
jgi:hypothetical protein